MIVRALRLDVPFAIREFSGIQAVEVSADVVASMGPAWDIASWSPFESQRDVAQVST